MGSNGIGGLATLSRDAAATSICRTHNCATCSRHAAGACARRAHVDPQPHRPGCRSPSPARGTRARRAASARRSTRSKDWLDPYYRDLALVSALRHDADRGHAQHARAARRSQQRRTPDAGPLRAPPAAHRHHWLLRSPHSSRRRRASRWRPSCAARMPSTVTCVGEGGTSEGDFHEGLNWASIYKLPVIFVVENNHWAISVPLEKQMAIRDVSIAAPRTACRASASMAATRSRSTASRARRSSAPAAARARRCWRPRSSASRRTPPTTTTSSIARKEDLQADRAARPDRRHRARLQDMGALSEEQDAEMQARVKQAVNEATDARRERAAARSERASTRYTGQPKANVV